MIDNTLLRDILDRKGLLFHPTTATLNDSRVRLRQNPNLEVKTLGYLNKGDKVDTPDRNGIKVQIDEMYG